MWVPQMIDATSWTDRCRRDARANAAADAQRGDDRRRRRASGAQAAARRLERRIAFVWRRRRRHGHRLDIVSPAREPARRQQFFETIKTKQLFIMFQLSSEEDQSHSTTSTPTKQPQQQSSTYVLL
jgi:hypothetical protein